MKQKLEDSFKDPKNIDDPVQYMKVMVLYKLYPK